MDRCRDSTEAVLTNGVDCVVIRILPWILPSKLKKRSRKTLYLDKYVLKYSKKEKKTS